jgi:hypothetical protein
MDKGGDINGFFERLDNNLDRSGLVSSLALGTLATANLNQAGHNAMDSVLAET